MEPSYGEESFFQASHLPRVPSGALDSAPLRRRSFGGGGDGLSMPDEDLLTGEDDSPVQRTFFLSAAMWWVLTSLALCAVLLGAPWSPGFAPWWLQLIAAAELYVSLRRALSKLWGGDEVATPPAAAAARPRSARRRRDSRVGLRSFVSYRLRPDAPPAAADELVARFLGAVEQIDAVLAVETGINCSPVGRAHGHTHAFLVSFAGAAQRDAYLVHPARRAFAAFAGEHADDEFHFDFEPSSGPEV